MSQTTMPVKLLETLVTLADEKSQRGSPEHTAFILGGASSWGWIRADRDQVRDGKPSHQFEMVDLESKYEKKKT